MAAGLIGAGVWAGCASGCSSGAPTTSGSPLTDVMNRELDVPTRVASVEPARSLAGVDPVAVAATQKSFRDIAWAAKEHPALRKQVLASMLNDPDAEVAAAARETVKLLLPRETSREVVVYLSQTAGERGWTDFVPPLIRSLSRPLAGVEEAERAERKAIEALSPGKTVEEVVFGVFLDPPDLAPTYGMDWALRFRADAWDLLARLDASGAMRTRLLAGASGGDATVATIRRCVADLRAMPITGDELKWVTSLQSAEAKKNAAWWGEAASAIARGEAMGPLGVRHAEAIRWASRHQPSWQRASREELVGVLRGRLKGRLVHQRRIESPEARVTETLDEWGDRLRWGDLIALLVIDEAVRQPGVADALVAQAGMDRRDETTEYGGAMIFAEVAERAPEGLAGDRVLAVLFPPRPGQRQGDQKFIASEDMIRASDRAVAHYHFHAQEERNQAYAGPSTGDLVYAARSGRTCVVFTSIGERELAVDVYQPDGIVIDLGSIVAK